MSDIGRELPVTTYSMSCRSKTLGTVIATLESVPGVPSALHPACVVIGVYLIPTVVIFLDTASVRSDVISAAPNRGSSKSKSVSGKGCRSSNKSLSVVVVTNLA